MRFLTKIPFIIFIAINLLLIVAMNFCAYTSCLPPQDYPSLSYFGLMFPIFLVANVIFILFWLIFKWKFIVLPLVGMLLCAGSIRTYIPVNIPVNPPAGSIKILTYNVMGFGKDEDYELTENPILLYLLNSNADIICVQEGRKNFVDRAIDKISEVYPYHSLVLVPDNYLACFSKFPLDSIGLIDYPTTSNYSMVYEILIGNDTLMLINNHLESYRLSPTDKDEYKSIIKNYKHPKRNDSESKYLELTSKLSRNDSVRGMQADSVAAFIERNKGRYIVACGDFNSSPISYTHYRLTDYLNDAYTRSGNGPGISYNRSGMYFRLDHILISPNITPYKAKVDKSIAVSDHYPVSCYIKLE